MPTELATLYAIDRFGVQAVTGRVTLRARDIRAMTVADTVVRTYRSRQNADSTAHWEWENPQMAAWLNILAREAMNVK
jgi:hypothetical protein